MASQIMGTCCSCGCEQTHLFRPNQGRWVSGGATYWIHCLKIENLRDPDIATLLKIANEALNLCIEDQFLLSYSKNQTWVRIWNPKEKKGSLTCTSLGWKLHFE